MKDTDKKVRTLKSRKGGLIFMVHKEYLREWKKLCEDRDRYQKYLNEWFNNKKK